MRKVMEETSKRQLYLARSWIREYVFKRPTFHSNSGRPASVLLGAANRKTIFWTRELTAWQRK